MPQSPNSTYSRSINFFAPFLISSNVMEDSIKEIELLDFHFNVPADGKITFEIHYASGVLPKTFPEPRAKVTRAEKAAAKTQKAAMQEDAAEAPKKAELAIIQEEPPIRRCTSIHTTKSPWQKSLPFPEKSDRQDETKKYK